jgi:restriction endonuclease S subunit
LNNFQLKNFRTPLPDFNEQIQIVELVTTKLGKVKSLSNKL